MTKGLEPKKDRRCRRGESQSGKDDRRCLLGTVPRSRDDGADEFHGRRPQRRRRGLGRHSGSDGRSETVAKAAGVPVEKVKVNTTLLGGGFGRRFEMDYVIDAVMLSKAVGKPVKVVWTREDDMQNDFIVRRHITRCQPASTPPESPFSGIIALLMTPSWRASARRSDSLSRLISSTVRPSRVHMICRTRFRIFSAIGFASDTGVPVGFWRSVGSSHTAFSTECFLDEVAGAAGKDPLEFRLSCSKNIRVMPGF